MAWTTYQFGGIEWSKVQWRSESWIATKEREPSQHPEDCADAIENGCVFKTEREVHLIMAADIYRRSSY